MGFKSTQGRNPVVSRLDFHDAEGISYEGALRMDGLLEVWDGSGVRCWQGAVERDGSVEALDSDGRTWEGYFGIGGVMLLDGPEGRRLEGRKRTSPNLQDEAQSDNRQTAGTEAPVREAREARPIRYPIDPGREAKHDWWVFVFLLVLFIVLFVWTAWSASKGF